MDVFKNVPVLSDAVPVVLRENGVVRYFKDAAHPILHRLDGPAMVCTNGTREWWVDGVFHRLDGPARVWPEGTEEWWINGKRHRVDGPAVVGVDSTRDSWWLFGEGCSAEDISSFYENLVLHFEEKDIKEFPHDVLKEMFLASKSKV